MATEAPRHRYFQVNLSGLARAMKMEPLALRSLLRGQESEYLKPIDDTPRGFYSCSDALLFACIARFGSRMTPAERQSLRKVISGPLKSVWKGAHFGGESARTFLGIVPGVDFPILGSEEEIAERCARAGDKRLGGRFEPLKLDVGKLSDALHADLQKLQETHPEEVKSFEAWAEGGN